MIRGVTSQKYASLMHDIERGNTTEESLVKRGILKPSTRGGISPLKRASAKIFSNRDKTKGKGKAGGCLVPTCNKSSSRRGLCNTHRTEAYRMIKAGKASEKNLLSRGLLLPKASGGTRVAGKKVVRRATKKTTSKKRHKSNKKAGKSKKTGTRFPKKLLTATTCLFRGCKSSRKGGSRGLCAKHYSQFKRKRSKLSDRQRSRQEKDLIRRRLLLPAKPKTSGKKLKRRSKKTSRPESSAFDIGATMHGSIRRY